MSSKIFVGAILALAMLSSVSTAQSLTGHVSPVLQVTQDPANYLVTLSGGAGNDLVFLGLAPASGTWALDLGSFGVLQLAILNPQLVPVGFSDSKGNYSLVIPKPAALPPGGSGVLLHSQIVTVSMSYQPVPGAFTTSTVPVADQAGTPLLIAVATFGVSNPVKFPLVATAQ